MSKTKMAFIGLIFMGLASVFYFYFGIAQSDTSAKNTNGKNMICGSNINWVAPQKEEKIELTEDTSSCSVNEKACRIQLSNDQWISLVITPAPVVSLKTLDFKVVVSNSDIIPDEIDLTGITINMGYLRPKLERVSDLNYHLQFQLPFCEEEEMKWKAIVRYKTKKSPLELKGAVFYFKSLKN